MHVTIYSYILDGSIASSAYITHLAFIIYRYGSSRNMGVGGVQGSFTRGWTTRMPYAIALISLKITAAQNEVALSYHRVRGLYFCGDHKFISENIAYFKLILKVFFVYNWKSYIIACSPDFSVSIYVIHVFTYRITIVVNSTNSCITIIHTYIYIYIYIDILIVNTHHVSIRILH